MMIKIQDSKLVIIQKYQNVRIFLQKVTLQIGQKKFLFWKTVPWPYLVDNLHGEKFVGNYYEKKELQKTRVKI